MNEEWMQANHGIYPYRQYYDEGPLGDNWSYIDTKTLCIVHFRPTGTPALPNKEATVLAGPFPTLDAAKAAYVVMYGSAPHGG